ncbi:hypothetical protein Tco_0275452, partial [Tanacetum coccineum]
EKKILEEDVEKLVEGGYEFDGDKFANTVLLSDEESGDRIEPGSHKYKPEEIVDDEKKDDDDKHVDAYDDKDDHDDNDDNDDHSLIRTRRIGSLEIRTENMQTPILSPLDPLGLNLWIRPLLRN